jgi:arylsulfatase A-like enzyme
MFFFALSAHATQPNIIFLLADDLRYDALGCNGNPLVQTPHLDQMAKDGVRFSQYFVTTPICMVSRASYLTGLHGRSHGVQKFDAPIPDRLHGLGYPYLLRQSGYWTAFAGKWGVDSKVPEDWFDSFEGFWGQGHYFEPGDPKHLDARLAEKAIAFIDACPKDKPFCVSISFKSPHADDPIMYPPDPAFATLYKDVTFPQGAKCDPAFISTLPDFFAKSLGRTRWNQNFAPPNDTAERIREYHRLVASQDAAVGHIRAALAERGLAENTVVIFSSDNGYFLGEMGLQDKWLLYEESIRVPLLVCGAGVAEAQRGTALDALALSIDIAPTMLDLAGAPVPPQWQGRSLKSVLGATATTPFRTAAFFEHQYWPEEIPECRGIRTLDEKWVYYPGHQYRQDFDLRADPEEMTNRHDALSPEMQAQRESKLNAWVAGLDAWRPDAAEPWRDPE